MTALHSWLIFQAHIPVLHAPNWRRRRNSSQLSGWLMKWEANIRMQRRMIEKMLNYRIYERGTNVENKFSRISFYNFTQKDKCWGLSSSFLPVYKLKTKQEDQSNKLSNFQEQNLNTYERMRFLKMIKTSLPWLTLNTYSLVLWKASLQWPIGLSKFFLMFFWYSKF